MKVNKNKTVIYFNQQGKSDEKGRGEHGSAGDRHLELDMNAVISCIKRIL
jgi:stress response protein SCP2